VGGFQEQNGGAKWGFNHQKGWILTSNMMVSTIDKQQS